MTEGRAGPAALVDAVEASAAPASSVETNWAAELGRPSSG